jgi:hypothetical protein
MADDDDDPFKFAEGAGAALVSNTLQGLAAVLGATAVDVGARAERDGAIAARLAKTLGESNEQVVRLRQSSALDRVLASNLVRHSKIATEPLPPAGSIVIRGRAVDANGAVVPGASVRLSDRAGTATIANPVVTDELGEFMLVVPGDAVDPSAEVFLVIEDPEKRLASPEPTPVRLDPKAPQRVAVVFSRPSPRRPTEPTEEKPSTRKRKKKQ